MAPLQQLIIGAFSLVIGVFLIVLASTVIKDHNGWPLFCLIFYVFAPVPFFLCGGGADRHRSYHRHSSIFHMLGLFIGGACAAAGPSLALVLYHVNSIGGTALALTLASGVCFLISTLALLASSASDDGSDDDVVEEDDIFQ